MQNNILFDNIYIGHSVEDAAKLAKETFFKKHPVEEYLENADKPKEEEKKKPESPNDLKFSDDPIKYLTEKLELFLTIAKSNPIEAVKFVPEIAGGLAAIVVTFLFVFVSVLTGSSAPAPVKKAAADAKDKAAEIKDKATKAAATGAEAVKSEVTKRKGGNKD